MKLKAGITALLMIFSILASAEDVSPTAQVDRHWWTIDYIGLGWQPSASGQDWGGTKDVKPFHNARKYGYNRGQYDITPSSGFYLGHQICESLFLELGLESSYKVYEGYALIGPDLADTTVSSLVYSVMVAPVYRFQRKHSGFSLGCRLGYSNFSASIETATASGLQGRLRQNADIFAYEPFARLDVGFTDWLKFGFDFGYASRNFFPVINKESSGIYTGAPTTDKNPDGTDTSVDFSGFTNKIFFAVVF